MNVAAKESDVSGCVTMTAASMLLKQGYATPSGLSR